MYTVLQVGRRGEEKEKEKEEGGLGRRTVRADVVRRGDEGRSG